MMKRGLMTMMVIVMMMVVVIDGYNNLVTKGNSEDSNHVAEVSFV